MTESTNSRSPRERQRAGREDLARQVLDNLLEGCQVVSPDFRYVYLNDAAAAQGRTTRDQLLGRTMMEAYSGIEATQMFAVLRRCMEERSPAQMENEFTFADGSKGWFELRFEPVPDGVAILSLDITARKQAEARMRHLNAVLQGIRDVNQLITRERDPQALIQQACRLLVEARGFHTSCIVLVEGERLLASADAGVEVKLRALRRIIASGSVPDCIRLALRQPGVVVRQDPTTSCADCPVNQDYMERRDTAAVRLESEGRTLGALLVSLPPGMGADQEELHLLREVAGDVAFALRSIELRAEQQRAEHAARESAQRYRLLFENANMGIAHCRMLYEGDRPVDFEYLEVNAALERLTGLKNAAGRRVSEVVPGIHESDPEMLQVYDRVVRTGGAERFEVYRKALQQWLDISVYSLERGQFVAVFDNITSRKRNEDSLLGFTRRLERLTSVVQDLSQARSVEAIVEVVRHAARALVGSDGATFVLRDGDLCHYVDEDAITPLWKGKKFPMSECISGWTMMHRKPALIEDIYADARIPHDAYRPTFVKSLVMVPIRRQSPIGAIGSYWASHYRATPEEVRILQALADSTSVAMENVRVLQDLEEGKVRTRALYDHLPNATFVWQRRREGFVLADFNEAARTVTQGAVGEFLGKPPRELCHAFPHVEADLTTCFEQCRAVRRETECALPGATGPRRMVLSYGFVPQDMAILLTEDVTETRKLHDQLLLSERMTSMGTLAAGVAHEINNPLAANVANLDFARRELEPLRDQLPGLDEVLEALKEAAESADRVRQIVRDLKVFSRADEERRGPVDVRLVLESAVRMVWNEIRHRATLQRRYGDEVPPVLANEARLGQVFLNLLVNAAQAISEGHADENFIVLSVVTAAADQVVIEVRDTGCGIAPDIREHIFEAFYTTKPVGVGTGLGLAICQRIVNELGGEIACDSEVGKGTSFRVTLPAATVVPDAARPVPTPTPRRRGKILVVDDEAPVARAIARALGPFHHVTTAASGREALTLLRSGAGFDLILSDVMMPEMTGAELYQELAQTMPEVALRMAFMTGGAFTPAARAFLDRVPNERIEKPVNTRALLILIERLLR